MAVNRILKLNSRDRETLVNSTLLSQLSVGTLAQMLEITAIASYEPRDVLFREGEPAENFYCVLSGYVRLYKLSKEGREADIEVYGPGDIIGASAVFTQDRYFANAQVSERATLARFDIHKVADLAAEEADLASALIGILSQHLQTALECSANDRLHTAPQRVAHYILQNCDGGGSNTSFRLPYQKSLLAGKLGLAPEALSRAFSMLREFGVSVRGRIIQIEDVDALRNVCADR